MNSAWNFGSQGYSLPGNQYVPLAQMEKQQSNQGQSMPSINPMQFMNMGQTGGGNAALDAWTGIGPGGGSGASGASGSSGMMSGLLSNPFTWIAAAIAGNELYQNNTGNRKGESFPLEYAITGRSAFKDKDVWGKKADSVIPGLGSGLRIAGGMSSPYDMLKGDTWKDIGKELKSGGVLGGLLKKVF
jgi:hypothetical protein